jgi:hypothetical protein
MKLVQLILLSFLMPLSCGATAYDPTPLLKKNHIFSIFLKYTFGDTNPFRDRCVTINLAAEIYQKLEAASSPENASYRKKLVEMLQTMEPVVSDAIEALAGDHASTDELKAFTQLTNQALFYINAHLGEYIASCKHSQKVARENNRILGSVLGLSLTGGTIKYIMLGVGGLIILGMLRSIYKTITYDVTKMAREVTENQRRLEGAINGYCAAVHNTFCQEDEQIQHIPSEEQLRGGWFARVFGPKNLRRRFSNWRIRRRQAAQHSLVSNAIRITSLIRELQTQYGDQSSIIQEAANHFRAWHPSIGRRR